jgi:hypothetical protein
MSKFAKVIRVRRVVRSERGVVNKLDPLSVVERVPDSERAQHVVYRKPYTVAQIPIVRAQAQTQLSEAQR